MELRKTKNGQLQKLLEIVQAADDGRQTPALAGMVERKENEVYLRNETDETELTAESFRERLLGTY